MPEREPQYRSPEDFSSEDSQRYQELESRTDELYRQQVELIFIWQNVDEATNLGGPNPLEVEIDEGKIESIKHRPSWDDFESWQEAGYLEQVVEAAVDQRLEEGGQAPKTEKDFLDREDTIIDTLEDIERGVMLHRKINQQLEAEDLLGRYKNFRLKELAQAREDLNKADQELDEIEERQAVARERNKPRRLRRLAKDYRAAFQRREDLIHSSPEAYYYYYYRSVLEAKRVFDRSGQIVETPYVKTRINRIVDSLEHNRPVFLHGETGTGKTELALHISRKYLSKEYLKRWEAENPPPAEDSTGYQDWLAKRREATEPKFIGGHRGLEVDQILGARAIKARDPIPPEEQAKIVEEAIGEYQEANPDAPKETLEVLRNAWAESFRSPLETKAYFAAFYQAMKEGRPIIIDEMNAIPHHTLIVLNNLLNREPGDVIHPQIDNADPFEVREGFVVIATGNWDPSGEKLYTGRQDLDSAFLRRWIPISYDFLPQHIEGEDFEQKATTEEDRKRRIENELYQMLLIRLMDSQLGVEAPKGSLEKLYNLARTARVFQDVFSGREVGSAYNFKDREGSTSGPNDILKENVLSLGHLIPIIESWKEGGMVRSLDDYLFLEYVERSDSRDDEKLYLYQVLQTQGNFFDIHDPDRDWPDATKPDQFQRIISYSTADKIYGAIWGGRKKPDPDQKNNFLYHSPIALLKRMFGEVERKRYPGLREQKDEIDEAMTEAEMAMLRDQIGEEARAVLADPDSENLSGEEQKLLQTLSSKEEKEEEKK
jgi:MoxR-like ATPase